MGGKVPDGRGTASRVTAAVARWRVEVRGGCLPGRQEPDTAWFSATASRPTVAVGTGGEQRAAIALRPRLSVREPRSDRDLSQGQFASEMGVSPQAVNSIEQERYTPSLPQALALALFPETTVEAMFDARD